MRSRNSPPGVDQAALARAEAALRTSEKRLELALQAVDDGVYDWSTRGGPVYLSPRFCEMLGYAPDEFPLTGDGVEQLVHPADRDSLRAIVQEYAAKTRDSHVLECRLRAKDGSYRWILSRGRVVERHPDGGIKRIVGTHADISSLKASAEALRETEERYRSVVNAMHEGVIILKPSGEITGCNRRAAEILGLTEEELLRRTPFDAEWRATRDDGSPFPGETHPSMVAALTGQSVTGGTMEIRRPNGEAVWLMINAEPIIDTVTHEVRAAVVTFTDFTERKKSQDEARIRENAMANAISALAIADAKGRIIYVNPSFLRMWGFDSEAGILGRSATRFWQSAAVARQVFDSLKTAGSWVGEMTAKRNDGSLFDAQLAASVVRDEQGAPNLVLASVLDITDTKRQALALRQVDERLSKVIANTPVVLFVLDKDGRFTLSEGKGLATLGLRSGQILGRSVFDVYQDFPAILSAVRRALAGEVIGSEVQVGDSFFEVRWEPQRGAANELAGLIGVALDITTRKRAENERASLMEQLIQAQKMESLGRLAGGVAHDFNNLLTVINGYSELALAKLPANDPTRAPLAEIRKAGQHAAQLTRQLLMLSRKQITEMKAVDLNALILESLEMLRHLAGDQVRIVLQLGRRLPRVAGDAGQFHQVLMNLVANARDAMPAGGAISIETSDIEVDQDFLSRHPEVKAGPHVLLTLSDSGAGMSSNVKQHIFEPFFTTKDVGRGTGLGLSTVYGIVRQCNGCIWVESDVGKGTTFQIVLPRAGADSMTAYAGTVFPPHRGHETVLIAEDQDEVRKLTAMILREDGYEVLEARTGWEALAVAAQHPGLISVLLTDCVMPGLSGPELAAEFTRVSPQTKVIYMTGFAGDSEHRAMPPEGVDLLNKPFSPATLLQYVHRVLKKG
ncbi:MAG: PAS domain S-box protein [Bryobacterales bacterium]|nr:PAS domain S-box protein [Bryobacterales bacterium]